MFQYINTKFVLLFLLSEQFYLSYQSPFKFPQTVEKENGDFVLAFNTAQNEGCVPLKDCPTYSWLLEEPNIPNEIINVIPENIKVILGKKRCVIEEASSNDEVTMDSLIVCPDTDNELSDYVDYEGEYEDEDYIEIGNRQEEDTVCDSSYDGGSFGALVATKGNQEIECSLEITHQSLEEDSIETLRTKSLSGKIEKYRRLKKLETREVLRMKAHGNCCWEYYQKPVFKNEKTYIEPGDPIYPTYQPRSIKRVCCSADSD